MNIYRRAGTLFDTLLRHPGVLISGRVNFSLLCYLIVVFTIFIFLLLNIVKDEKYLVSSFTIDDTFYYLEIAWRAKQLGFLTFDGINETNGVHFLWYLIVFGIACLSANKTVFLYGVLSLTFALALYVYRLIWRVGSLTGDRTRILTLLLALSWTLILSFRQHQFLSGMESMLHMVILWSCLIAFIEFHENANSESQFPFRSFLKLTLFIVLLTWTRLDSVIYSFTIYLSVLIWIWVHYKRRASLPIRYLSVSMALVLISAMVQIGFYLQSADTVLPISGLVKSIPASTVDQQIASRFLSVLFPFETYASLTVQGRGALGAILVTLLLTYVAARSMRVSGNLKSVFLFTVILGVSAGIYALVIAGQQSFGRWYLSPIYLFYILSLSLVLLDAYNTIKLQRSFSVLFKSGYAVLFVFLLSFLMFFMGMTYRPIPVYSARYELGTFLDATAQQSDILASFNAGQIGFFSERPTINLDGLVNSRFYLENIIYRPDALVDYLKEHNVRYLVDYDLYWLEKAIRPYAKLRYEFPVNDRDGRVVRVFELIWN